MSKRQTKGERSRARIVATAADLLRRHGYYGTGLSQIIKESGTPKGSLYFYFPGGKVELTQAALRESGSEFGQRLEELITPETPPAEAIEIACKALGQQLAESNYEQGCPLATVALEAATSLEPIREICAEHFTSWRDLIETTLASHDLGGERARDLATTILASIEGAMLLCRAYHSTEPLEGVARQWREFLS